MFHAVFQRNLRASITHMPNKLEAVEERIDFLESQLSEVAKANNTVVDKQDDHSTIICQLQLQIADLEDCSRWNNIKIRGIPESVTPGELNSYLQ